MNHIFLGIPRMTIRKLHEGRNSFVIAHRLSTICPAQQILVINNGEIVERGTHEEMVKAKGFCRDHYMSPFKGRTGEIIPVWTVAGIKQGS